ncbi:MAG: hypothetical protein Q9161_009070 [Pseudevernia consocians]
MKFTKHKKEPKKTPEEEYVEQISTLTENELRDLHKDLKIDHYGNSTAAVINTASGVGLLSMRSTTRRYRTECMQIEAMEARMKEMGWTPHPNRYRDAVPIALGVAAGTTAGMSFGLINVEKNAKRTKDYVKKKDLFKTKELVETKETDAETEEAEADDAETEVAEDVVEEVEVAESPGEHAQALEMTTAEHVTVERRIARKPVPGLAATDIDGATPQPEDLAIVAETTAVAEDTSVLSAEPIVTTERHALSVDVCPSTESKMTKKEALFSQVSVMNKKMRSFHFKKDKEEKETMISVTEIACDVQSPVVDADAVISHGIVGMLESPPVYASEENECVA